MTPPTPQAAIFDMDGTLIDTERLAFLSFSEACAAFDQGVDEALFHSLIGLPAAAGDAILKDALAPEVPFATFSEIWRTAFDALVAAGVPVKDGAGDLLAGLRDRGVPTAIATSTRTDRAREMLGEVGLLEFFVTVVGGDAVSNGKPAPDIFIEAAGRLDIGTAHCVAFEDSPNGVRAAVAAGMTVVQVPDFVAPDETLRALGHHIAPSLLAGAALVGLNVD